MTQDEIRRDVRLGLALFVAVWSLAAILGVVVLT